MVFIVATKEEFELCGIPIDKETRFNIPTPYGIDQEVIVRHAGLDADGGLEMIRLNKNNFISDKELQYIKPIEEGE